jgi:hypothetical protein
MGAGPGERVYVEVVPEALAQLVLGGRDAFLNKTICVDAVVQRIEGRLTMIVSKPADLGVLTSSYDSWPDLPLWQRSHIRAEISKF